MTKGVLDKIDMKILKKLSDEGPSFFSSASWEMRASDMICEGYMHGEMVVYSMTGGGKPMNLKNRYTITDKGIAALKETANV